MKYKVIFPVILVLAAAVFAGGCITDSGMSPENDPILGTFIYSEYVYADYLEGYSDGVTACPSYVFLPDGAGAETWVAETGEQLPSQSFTWEKTEGGKYHVGMINGDGTFFSEDLLLSEDGNKLTSNNPKTTGYYTRIADANKDDPIVGTYKSKTYDMVDFLYRYSDGIMVRPTITFYASGIGVESWEGENGDALSPLLLIWEKTGDNTTYRIHIQNADNSLFESTLTLSDDGASFRLMTPEYEEFFVKTEVDDTDRLLGLYFYSEFVMTDYLRGHSDGISARPGFLFFPDGTGIEIWESETGVPLYLQTAVWKNLGNNRYHINTWRADGTVFSADAVLSDDGTELTAPDWSGKYVKAPQPSETDPVLGAYSYSELIDTDFLKGHSDGIRARPGLIFYPDSTGTQVWTDKDGNALSPLPYLWLNKGENEYHLVILDATGAAFSEDLTLSGDGNELVSHYDTWNGKYVRTSAS